MFRDRRHEQLWHAIFSLGNRGRNVDLYMDRYATKDQAEAKARTLTVCWSDR